MWVAIELVALLGIRAILLDLHEAGTLDEILGNKIVVTRSTGKRHSLSSMNLQFDLPTGWAYLSTGNDAFALAPTFLHQSEQVTLRIQRAIFKQPLPYEGPLQFEEQSRFRQQSEFASPAVDASDEITEKSSLQTQTTGMLQWIDQRQEFAFMVSDEDNIPIRLNWQIRPTKRVARWTGEAGEFLVEMVDLRSRHETPECVRRLLDQIQLKK